MKSGKRFFVRLFFGLLGGILLLITGYYFIALTPVGPLPEALPYLQSDSAVQVETNNYLYFQPLVSPSQTGLIIYPGGRVDYRSYAPLAKKLAKKGWPVAVVPMPLNLAVFGSNRAAQVITDHPEVPRWAIGGHSLGGSMAAQFEIDHPGTTTGIVFLAAYPPSDKLAASTMDALVLYASEDGLIPAEDWKTYKPRFPIVTRWQLIQGGNHAGFGWYGEQKGDHPAAISLQVQTEQIVQSIDEFLKSIDYASK
jgi:pimeloyl-ACP methyl ester carboxylesterase